MKQRFKLYRRSNGRFYAEDTITGKQSSLATREKAEANRLLHARNEAAYQPAFNKQMAKTYLAAGDPRANSRTWQDVFDYLLQSKEGLCAKSQERYVSAAKDPALDPLRNLPLIHTTAETFYKVLKDSGKPCTNMYLRRFHSFALQLGWLAWPILGYNQWPKFRFKERRGVTWEEHQLLLSREKNVERRAFLELLWHVGAAQIDLVNLKAEDVDWKSRTITYNRQKTGRLCTLRFGDEVAEILKRLPTSGPLFPKYSTLSSADRATRFAERVERLGIRKRSEEAGIPSICLHSYRYSWAERARAAGYPERYAQEALGHQSNAIHRAYAKRAHVELPPLEQYEKRPVPSTPQPNVIPSAPQPNIIPLPSLDTAATATGSTANEPAASQPTQMQQAV
jgi:integrase